MYSLSHLNMSASQKWTIRLNAFIAKDKRQNTDNSSCLNHDSPLVVYFFQKDRYTGFFNKFFYIKHSKYKSKIL
jgi:hypothetical protein